MNTTIKKRIEEINSGRVPEGYEKTSFGIFPCDWEKSKTLKDLGKFGKGRGIPGNKLISEGVPCVGYGDIYMKYNYHFEKAQSFVDENTAAESQKIRKGTLLFTATGETAEEIGKCVCYNGEEDIYAGGDIITFIPDRINSMFIAYQQYQNYALRQKASFGQGHSVVHIQKDRLEKLHIAYPQSSQEQSRIAEILMQWDKAIELQEKYIKQLELRKKALMQRLLTPKEGWKDVKIDEIFEITRGQVLPVSECNDEYLYPVYSSQTANGGLMGYYNKYLFENAITWTTDGANAGNVNYRKGKFYCTNVCGVLINNEGYANYCIAYLLNLVTEKYVSFVGNPKLMNNVMANITINIPPIEEQKIVSKIMELLDGEIVLHTQKLDKIIEQRKALQQYLLTGIVRV